MKASTGYVEILQALAAGNIILVDEDKIPKVEAEIPEPEPQSEEKTEITQETEVIPEQ